MEEDSPQANTLSIASRATTIRRIKIYRSPLPSVTHKANNATSTFRFQNNLRLMIFFGLLKKKTGRSSQSAPSQGEGYSVLSVGPNPVEEVLAHPKSTFSGSSAHLLKRELAYFVPNFHVRRRRAFRRAGKASFSSHFSASSKRSKCCSSSRN